MFSTKRQLSLGILAAIGGLGVALPAFADSPQSTIILNTSTTLIKQAPNGDPAKPVKRCSGAGVMDTRIAYDSASGLIASTLTWSSATVNNDNSYMQGALALATLDGAQGLVNQKFIELPQLNGERPHMRPNVAIGSNFVVDIFASEDNGINNGNPQAVAWVFDRSGNMLNITNTNRGTAGKPVNLITLSGQNDGQQYGPHDVCNLGPDPAGGESFIVTVQRNNQQAKVMKVNVVPDGNGGVTVNVPYLKTYIQNAQHNRGSLACPTSGAAGSTIVATAVEANDQPADIGVRAALIDTATGKTLASQLISASDPNNNMYSVQPTAQYIDSSHVAITYQTAGSARKYADNGDNGHGNNNANLSHVALVRFSTTSMEVVDTLDRAAPFQRHSEAFALNYGPVGKEGPGVGVIAASSTGMGKALMQVIPVDTTAEKLGQIDPMKMYEVASYGDVAALPARAKRNPNNQGRGFIHGLYGLQNPGYQKANGFMPEVKTFSLSAVAGYNNPTTDNRDSLFFSLVPATWDPQYATVPGSAGNVAPGPSPVAAPGTVATNPGPTATGVGDQTGGPVGQHPSGSSGSGNHAPGYGDVSGQASNGCACTTAPGSSSGGAGGLALLGVGLALLGIRRTKKEA